MATTTATNNPNQAPPSPFTNALVGGFPPRSFQPNTSSSPASTPISSTSTSSNNGAGPSSSSSNLATGNTASLFPGMMLGQSSNATALHGLFNQQQQQNYYAALMQSGMMQQFMKQYMSDPQQQMNGATVDSRSPSAAASPSATSFMHQQQRKLLLDSDGNITCPICEQKLGPDSWSAHVELERSNLVKSIESLKENKRPNLLNVEAPNSPSADSTGPMQEVRKKREFELARIRSNQRKRLSMKSSLLSSTLTSAFRDPNPSAGNFLIGSLCNSSNVTGATAPLGEELASPRSGATTLSLRESADLERNFCKSCERSQEFLIIANGLEEPRCMDCYRKYRRQIGSLPLTITESPTDEHPTQKTQQSNRRGSHTTSSNSPCAPHQNGSDGSLQDEEEADFDAKETASKRPRLELLNA